MTVTTTVLLQKKKMNNPRQRQSPPNSSLQPNERDDESITAGQGTASPAPTISTTAGNSRKNPSPEDYYQAFDRHFAARYMQLVDAHRKRNLAIASGQLPSMKPRMQIYSPPSATHVTALFELPGLKNSDITVNVTRDGKLTVSGERKAPPVFADPDLRGTLFPVQEIKYGRFERSLNIPPGVESRHITASLNDGMLSLSWPRMTPSDARSPTSPPITSVQALIH